MAWAPDYLTTTQVKDFRRIDPADTLDDVEIAVAISAASRAIDDHCNRQFGLTAAPEERFYTAWYDYDRGRWVVDVDDFMTTTGLVVSVDGTALTTFTKEPLNAAALGRPWERLVFDETPDVYPTGVLAEVSAVARWGWTAVPTQVVQATHLQVNRLMSRRDAPFGVAGSPEQGSEIRLLARLDPDVAVSLKGLRRARRVG